MNLYIPTRGGAIAPTVKDASNERRRLQSAVLPDGDIVRLVTGLYCPCGRNLRCDPEPMGDGGFRLLCDGCHGDVMVYEPGRRP